MEHSRVAYKRLNVTTDDVQEGSKKSRKCTKRSLWKVTAIVVTFLTILLMVFANVGYPFSKQFYTSSTMAADVNDHQNKSGYNMRKGHIHYKHTKRRLPQCIIIGVRKAGTRALLRFMNLHPGIQIAGAEIHFFDIDDNYSLSYDWYRKKMPYSFSDQITVEKTPAYFVEDAVPERVYEMNSSIKLILIVREPTERAISDYAQIHEKKMLRNIAHETFEELVITPDTGEVNQRNVIVSRSLYHRPLDRWLKYFPLEQIHIVDGDVLVQTPWIEVSKVETFLHLEHKITKEYFYYNKTRGFYCIKQEVRNNCLNQSKGRKHPAVDPDVVKKLHEFYRPHNEKFFRRISRRFDWP